MTDDLLRAELFGAKPGMPVAFRIIERPAGPQPLPAWAKKMDVYWAENYTSSPSFHILTSEHLTSWKGKRWTRDGDRWSAVHDDGRCDVLFQGGPLQLATVRRFRAAADGAVLVYPRQHGCRAEAGEWVDVERLCTRQEDGFAGRHYEITMQDGTDVVLRGPWSGGTLPGYQAVTYHPPEYQRAGQHWRRGLGFFGAAIRRDVLVRLASRFLPHLELAEVDQYGYTTVQPLEPETGEPKEWRLARRRVEYNLARAAKAGAA